MASRFEKAWKGRIKREKEKKRRKKKKLTIDLARILNSKLQKQIESNLDCDAVCITKFTANGFFKVLTPAATDHRPVPNHQPHAHPHATLLSRTSRTSRTPNAPCAVAEGAAALPTLVLPCPTFSFCLQESFVVGSRFCFCELLLFGKQCCFLPFFRLLCLLSVPFCAVLFALS